MTQSEVAEEARVEPLPPSVTSIIRRRKVKLDYLANGEALFGQYRRELSDLRSDTIEQSQRDLIRLAEKMFGGSAPLSISDGEVVQLMGATGYQLHSIRDVSLTEMWRALEKQYGGDNGKKRACQQLAEHLIRGFGISSKKPPEFKKDCLVMSDPIYVNKDLSQRMSHSSVESVRHLLNTLEDFLIHVERPFLAAEVKNIGKVLSDWQRKIVSREKFELIDQTDRAYWISIVTYNVRFEYTFSQSLSHCLQQFIAEYGTELLRARG